MGGLNGVDNAKLTFDNVRVPRVNLLNKFSDITPEGEFVTTIKQGGRARFLAMADQLLSEEFALPLDVLLPARCAYLLLSATQLPDSLSVLLDSRTPQFSATNCSSGLSCP